MKFTAEKSSLVSCLVGASDIARSISENDSSRYILKNIKLEVKNNILTSTGTDADTVVKNRIPVFAESDGEAAILGQLIDDVIKKFDDGAEVVLEYKEEENLLYINSGKSKFKLNCISSETFPSFEEQSMTGSFTVAREDFINIIEKTRFATSDDAAKYYLNGMYLHTVKEDGAVNLAAAGTDGHKLSVIKLAYFNGEGELSGLIIPKKTLPEIKKILASNINDKEVEVFFSKTKIKIQTSRSTIISKLIDADFPDYKRVIPTENDKILQCDKTALVKSINRVASIVSEAHKGIKFIINDKNTLVIDASCAKNGSASEEVSVEFDSDAKVEIAFNSKNLLEILSQIESDKVIFNIRDNFCAAIIKGSEELNNTFILMPVRI
jgi:DNA polymerase-3 subunit beta